MLPPTFRVVDLALAELISGPACLMFLAGQGMQVAARASSSEVVYSNDRSVSLAEDEAPAYTAAIWSEEAPEVDEAMVTSERKPASYG